MPIEDKDQLEELAEEEGSLFLEPRSLYDRAIIGISSDGRIVYDDDECVRLLVEQEGWDWHEAREYHDFNTVGAYVGPKTPIFMSRVDLNDDSDGPDED